MHEDNPGKPPDYPRDEHGRWLPTIGISTYFKTGRVPLVPGKRQLRRRLNDLRYELEKTQKSLTPQRLLLIKQIVDIEAACQLAFNHLRKRGSLRPDSLTTGVLEFHPVFANTIMRLWHLEQTALEKLGLDGLPDQEPTILDVIAELDAKEAQEASKDAEKRAGEAQDGRSGEGGIEGGGEGEGS